MEQQRRLDMKAKIMKVSKLSIMTLMMILAVGMMSEAEVEAAPKLNKKKVTIAVGKTYTLKTSGTNRKATWKTNKKSVARISKKKRNQVRITAVKAGKAVVSAKIGKKTYKCTVTVVNPKISKKTLNLTTGQSSTLKVTGGTGAIKWKSSNTAVATVSTSGRVTARKVGTVKITATRNKKNLTCIVTVKAKAAAQPTPPAQLLKLDKTTISVEENEEVGLSLPNAKGTVKWTSSNTAVATVDASGWSVGVLGRKAGTATITATHNKISYTCTVTVKAKPVAPPASSTYGGTFTRLATTEQQVFDEINRYRAAYNVEKGWTEGNPNYLKPFLRNTELDNISAITSGYISWEWCKPTAEREWTNINQGSAHFLDQISSAGISWGEGMVNSWVKSPLHQPSLIESVSSIGIATYVFNTTDGSNGNLLTIVTFGYPENPECDIMEWHYNNSPAYVNTTPAFRNMILNAPVEY